MQQGRATSTHRHPAGGPRTTRPEDGRRINLSLVLQSLYDEPQLSRADLARRTGLTRVTISDLVAELMIVGSCLPEPVCDPADWAAVAAVQHPDGLVPRDGDPVSEDPARRFADHQHTAVVAAVAGSIAVSRTLA